MPTLQNTILSPRFSSLNTLIDIFNRGDWEGSIAALPKDFVFEFVVFDGPNLCFTKEKLKEHFDSVPGYKPRKSTIINAIEGDNQVFLHMNSVEADAPYVGHLLCAYVRVCRATVCKLYYFWGLSGSPATLGCLIKALMGLLLNIVLLYLLGAIHLSPHTVLAILQTETRFMIASPPAGHLHYELLLVVHIQDGQVKRMQMATDTKTLAEITLTPDAV